MYYIVYKITNMVNGKIYIGVHKTDDLNDNYMGSGKRLKQAHAKYGMENFKREYLHVFDNPEDMFKMESELVNEEFISREDTYNLKVGGFGGWDYVNNNGIPNPNRNRDTTAATNAVRHRFKTDEAFYLKRVAELAKGKQKVDELYPNGTFFGKTHSEATKNKISEKAKLRTGDKNSSFGTMWIVNVESGEPKKIKKDEPIPHGWIKGRKL